MAWKGTLITKRGRDLLAKAQKGIELKFTRCKVGDAFIETDPDNLLDIVNFKKECPIASIKVVGDGTAAIEMQLYNQGLTEGFFVREIGVYANDPDIGEILYAYVNDADKAFWLPPESFEIIEALIRILVIVGKAQNITAIINDGLIFVTKKEYSNHAHTGNDGTVKISYNDLKDKPFIDIKTFRTIGGVTAKNPADTLLFRSSDSSIILTPDRDIGSINFQARGFIPKNIYTYKTAGEFTYVPDEKTQYICVICIGGGCSGGYSGDIGSFGGGGGGGIIMFIPNPVRTIFTVGEGSNNYNTAGGTTSFGTHGFATGGIGYNPGIGQLGSALGFISQGSRGELNTYYGGPVLGGSSAFGIGPGRDSYEMSEPSFYGGGGGAYAKSSGAKKTAGSDGGVIILEF